MNRRWIHQQPDMATCRRLRRRIGCSPVLATVIANRNFPDIAAVEKFLSPSLADLRSPFSLRDMEKSADRIMAAIAAGENILVFGDYDVDGVTATAVLYQFLNRVGASVEYYIPHRLNEGYGLRRRHIEAVARPRKIGLIITVDCGSASHDAVAAAGRAGIDVIVTDHHHVTELPAAYAVVNPKRPDCTAGLDHLAGVGVAFYLVMALRHRLRAARHWQDEPEPNLRRYCDLVALGTIADLVPMLEENRVLTQTGLQVITEGSRPGIRAMTTVGRFEPGRVSAEAVAFKLAPRLNAAGRMRHAGLAVELLTASEDNDPETMARALGELNRTRQITEKEVLTDIERLLQDYPVMLDNRSLVITHPGWHGGLLGIVAAKLVDKFFRPVILLSEENGLCKGSARSIPGFNLVEGLSRCAPLLEQFGGHHMAAGLTLKKENLGRFREAFESDVQRITTHSDFTPMLIIDGEIGFHLIDENLLNELERLQPFGIDNAEPLFSARQILIQSSSVVGNGHRRMRLAQRNARPRNVFDAIYFNAGENYHPPDTLHEVAFRLQWNRWNGTQKPQLVVEDMRPMPSEND